MFLATQRRKRNMTNIERRKLLLDSRGQGLIHIISHRVSFIGRRRQLVTERTCNSKSHMKVGPMKMLIKNIEQTMAKIGKAIIKVARDIRQGLMIGLKNKHIPVIIGRANKSRPVNLTRERIQMQINKDLGSVALPRRNGMLHKLSHHGVESL